MSGQLFTHYFFTDGIKATVEWKASLDQPEAFAAFRDGVAQHYEALSRSAAPNESTTELDLIRPILDLLGWTDYLPQQGADHNEDIPDHLLFADAGDKRRAATKRKPGSRYRDALVVQESKRFGLVLDAQDDKIRSGTPHGQILRYLSTADTASDGRIRWGILTNGRVWRLYDYHARPRASGYFEADLTELLEPGNEDGLRVFHLLFQRDSFTPQQGATMTFLEAALAEGRRYEERVAQDLSGVVFERVFPNLVQAIADVTEKSLAEVREAALIFLYRLLFVLYAEDRGLLPVNDSRYDDYGLRKRGRDDVARRMADKDTFSAHATSYYDHLMTLFRLIDKGDPSIGLPPYNGGLFASETATLLEEARLPDNAIAPIIYDLSHTTSGERRFVNYRDMSVQQLGSIYERLLEHEPVRDEDDKIIIRPNPYARKDSGSFFTPQELVDLIVERTLKPLAEERLKAFEDKAAELKSQRRPKTERKAELLKLDPAEAVLNLKVLDPAMGSGHFLVTAVDFLSDYVAELIECVPAIPEWRDAGYASPLVKRVATIRKEILQRAKEADWVMDESQLTDQAIIRRMVLKRCIYGVDKNPLTVELAKVSLWLHSFTVGAPLSFLDHHLRCGDSLVGLRVFEATEDLRKWASLFLGSAIAGAEAATEGMQSIEEMSDADVAEVRESAALFHEVEETTAELRGILNSLCGLRWFTAGMKQKKRAEFERPLVRMLALEPEDAYMRLARGPEHEDDVPPDCDAIAWSEFVELWRKTISIAGREGFLHWEVAFPGIWRDWQSTSPEGGFDAVIGNPPWDRIKLQEVEWFATRDPELALAPTAAARGKGIQQLRKQGSPLAVEFDEAKERADRLGEVIRGSGDYPLLSAGDINLYSLFVERAMNLIKPDGFVGLLTPSGIYADKTAARFFKSVSTNGRVGGLFDFENRRLGTDLPPFFPDVDSRFKFCALIFGGEERRFDETKCAFFLHDTKEIHDEHRCFPLTPDDFTRVNPNTGTAPVFRTRRDAEITRLIYERHPVLVDRSGGEERKVWPVKYATMFHMANDSHLFRTADQLAAEGFYPVEGNRWKKGKELYLPLYEGKMVQAFDHRAASITNREGNLFRPGQPDRTLDEEYCDSAFSPCPRYWISLEDSTVTKKFNWFLAFKDITASTNVRTMIASAVPQVGCGHTLPIILPSEDRFDVVSSACLLANLNSFSFDYVARQKVQATHLTWFVVEQLPVIAPADYDRPFGAAPARNLVRDHVLRLTYTAHDMAPFARDLGYDGPPFAWNEEERRHLRARLDALYFLLYGLTKEDAEYVLETFPIVRKEDEAAFGRYRTRDLILAYMNALSAGDTETKIAI
ncbi:MAG: restriction endonuclease [Nitrospira sp. SB0675_bin_23]|nr:restriction endonuclease [Nitrospira sp. SB0675_bin_23]